MRRSMCSSPGNHGSWSGGMVLTYGVETVAGKPTWFSRARSSSFISRNRARVLPVGVQDGVEGVDPLRRLLGVDVGELVRESVEDHSSIVALNLAATVQELATVATSWLVRTGPGGDGRWRPVAATG